MQSREVAKDAVIQVHPGFLDSAYRRSLSESETGLPGHRKFRRLSFERDYDPPPKVCGFSALQAQQSASCEIPMHNGGFERRPHRSDKNEFILVRF
jgi:hypothetical protein